MNNISLKLTVTFVVLFLVATTTTTNAQSQAKSSYIYGIAPEGKLMWYRHVGSDRGLGLETPGAWLGANEVGRGWNGFLSVFPGGANIIYLIRPDGTLDWRQHLGVRTGLTEWGASKVVGRGWNGFKEVFSGGSGILYVIETGGKLRWYRHNGYLTGTGMDTPGAWEGPREVGRGWADFKQVFPGGDGIIYAITPDGKLRWYKHNGYLTGAGVDTPGAWEGPKEVGRGWADFQNVFSAGNGIIYAITQEGKLIWYKHNGYLDGKGLDSPGAWENPKEIGRGWADFVQVFALLPGSSSTSRTPPPSSTSSNSDSATDGPGQPASRVPDVVGVPPTSYPLRVRGGGNLRVSAEATQTATLFKLVVEFTPGTARADAGLRPGQGAWLDRAMGQGEPTRLEYYAQETDAKKIIDYLRSTSNYYIFECHNTGKGYMQVTRAYPKSGRID